LNPVLDTTLLDLGAAATRVDPFTVQPGIILFERFCVVGRVRHSADFWRVQATDIHRQLGLEPYHRVDLHFLPQPLHPPSSGPQAVGDEAAIRASLPAHQRGTRRIEAVLSTDDGLVVVSVPGEEAQIRLPLSPEDAMIIARALTGIALASSRAGVVGFRFDLRDLRFDAFGDLQFAAWRHLTGLRLCTSHEDPDKVDAAALVEVLRSLNDPALSRAIASFSGSVSALAQALEDRRPEQRPSVSELLPSVAPFAGRELVLRRLHEAMAAVRHGGPEVFVVTGQQGMGRSRLLRHLALEFQRWNTLHLVRIECSATAPNQGLSVLLDAVAEAIESRPPRERPDIITRIRRAIGTMEEVLSASPRLLALVGETSSLHPLQVEEAFIRRSSCIADCMAALGTAERPLAVLIDDFDQADASIRSVIHHLVVPTREHHSLLILAVPEAAGLGLPREGVTLPLGPLPAQSVKEMLAATIPGPVQSLERVAGRLFAEARGNPEQTWNLLLSWVYTGTLAPSERGSWVLHDEAGTAPAARGSLRGVSDAARAIAALVAVKEEPVVPGWLAELPNPENHAWQPRQVRNAAGELLEAGILIQDTGGRLSFATELIRARTLGELDPAEVQRAHASIQQWLLGRGSPVLGQLAWHAEHATSPGTNDELGSLHLRAGQDHMNHGDATRALWHFQRSLERTTDAQVRTACLRGMADALVLKDRSAEALRAYLEVIDRVEPREGLAIANDAMHSFYLRGATNEMLMLAERALAGVGQWLPRNGWDAVWMSLWKGLGTLFRTGPTDPAIADGLASIHVTLVAGAATTLPHIGVGSVFSGLWAASRRVSGAAARARAFFSVLLASAGLERWMRSLLDKAEQDAQQAGDSMALGAVLHLRGQNELSLGYYDAGAQSMERALHEFRRIGDLSVGVISMGLAAYWAMDREPTQALLHRLRVAEATAWRQRNTSVLPLILGLRLYVRARSGELDANEVERASHELGRGDLLTGVMGEGLAAMALVRVGEPSLAFPIATRARARLAGVAPAAFLEVARLAEALAAVEAGTPLQTAQTSVRKLERKAKRVRSLQISASMVRARLLLREGDITKAIAVLASVVERTPIHGERWHTLEAHRLLSELLAGRDVLAAQAHESRYRQLAQELGYASSKGAAPSPAIEAEPAGASSTTSGDIRLWGLLDNVGRTLQSVLQPEVGLQVHAAAGVRTLGDAELIELLVVNLVLLVRDSISGSGEVVLTADEVEVSVEDTAIHDLRAGRWARIEVRAEGPIGKTSRGGLMECRTLCHRCSGHLLVDASDSSLRIEAFLPAPHGPPPPRGGLAAVVHGDVNIRRALVEGIRSFGWSVVELPPGEDPPHDAALVLVEAPLVHLVPPTEARLVRVARRGEPCKGPLLRVPYLVGELEAVLNTRSGGPSTSAGAKPPG
jgi:hypothetical protein